MPRPDRLPFFSISALLVLFLTLTACHRLTASGPPATSTSPMVTVTVYFTDLANFQVGTEPYERAVTRTLPLPPSLPRAVLAQLFLGPTPAEKAAGLDVFLSGATGFSQLTLEAGVARVYLTGACASKGAAYTLANLIMLNLKQFPEIRAVKIYDQNGETETPAGPADSIPFCLEP